MPIPSVTYNMRFNISEIKLNILDNISDKIHAFISSSGRSFIKHSPFHKIEKNMKSLNHYLTQVYSI